MSHEAAQAARVLVADAFDAVRNEWTESGSSLSGRVRVLPAGTGKRFAIDLDDSSTPEVEASIVGKRTLRVVVSRDNKVVGKVTMPAPPSAVIDLFNRAFSRPRNKDPK